MSSPDSFLSKLEYTQVPVGDDDENSSTASERSLRASPRRCGGGWFWCLVVHPSVPWTLSLLFASLSLFLVMLMEGNVPQQQRGRSLGTFAAGYATDFITARKHIQVAQTSFTGGPAFDDNGKIFIPNPSPKMFVGDPIAHPEIDYNWDNLTWGRYVLVTKDEAVTTWGEENVAQYWDKQRGGYVTGFDMFHTLHCLNNLRKALNPSIYGSVADISHGVHKDLGHGTPRSRRSSGGSPSPPVHQDHCIEQIRQYIMCSGDMTPIPTKYYPGLGRNYVESDVPHTCRNFDLLHDWMVDRYDGPGAVRPVFA